jgi:tRNA-specific 2-thiouridylase
MMNDFSSAFADHACSPRGGGALPGGATLGAAGGSACGDFLTFGLVPSGGRIAEAGFVAEGCAALTACASVVTEMITGKELLTAAQLGREKIAGELGGLSPERRHAAVLAEEALHRALGALLAEEGRPLLAAAPGRVLVGLSGGVDSAVAARTLIDAGRQTIGVTLQLWDDPATDGTASCCSPQAVSEARRMAHALGMAHFTVDLRDDFRRGVVDPYLEAFEHGLTPNPCVGCNGHVRFDALDALRARLGAQSLATGHYARIEGDDIGPLLAAAADSGKDQTYMLAAVEPKLLARLEFPLGELTKPEVRERARAAGLAVAEKPESQDLCFLAGIGRDGFVNRHADRGDDPGPILNIAGDPIGEHRGAWRFTVGQRRGLGIAAPEPLYVLDVDPDENAVVVGPAAELTTWSVRLIGARLMRDGSEVDCVKLRYRTAATACRIPGDLPAGHHRELQLDLIDPASGAAPGQIACLMRGQSVVGWATIARTPPQRGAKLPGDELQRDPRDISVVL